MSSLGQGPHLSPPPWHPCAKQTAWQPVLLTSIGRVNIHKSLNFLEEKNPCSVTASYSLGNLTLVQSKPQIASRRPPCSQRHRDLTWANQALSPGRRQSPLWGELIFLFTSLFLTLVREPPPLKTGYFKSLLAVLMDTDVSHAPFLSGNAMSL